MTLLLSAAAMGERRVAAQGPLQPLLASLRGELVPVIARHPTVPLDKARLSRAGGVCPRDGTRLDFDPRSPDEHRCPRCGAVERGEPHYRAWLMWYQLWLAERAVHGALLHLLDGHQGELELATRLLEQYAESYLRFPNKDNALGPSRIFFSTYLESIWVLQVCIALDLVEMARHGTALSGALREKVIEPAARLIAMFDEGQSNRQVWNNAAMIAAGRLLGDSDLVDNAIHGRSGLVAHLTHGLLADGSWFEGENYHVFAHRGLWYCMTMLETAGVALPPGLVRRFDEGYAIPWLTALPDMTLPSRRDSPYAVSLRQWRFAEMAELGLARSDDERLRGPLAALYLDDIARADTGRSRSAADVERNVPPSALSRADLGWRALLRALPVLGELKGSKPGSVVLAGQGLGVLRQDDGRIHVALDYGHAGGGHGHPDRLGLTIADGATRWLDDPGTGSYVDPTLHWYRSTLAHNAPLVDSRSQAPTHGELLGFDVRDGAAWIDARASELAPGVVARRTIVAMPGYVVDRLEWSSGRPVQLDLPLHADGETIAVEWAPLVLRGAGGLEDGFDFVTNAERAVPAGTGATDLRATHPRLELQANAGDSTARVTVLADPPVEWLRASAPGVPGSGARRFHLARREGTGGCLTTIWDLRQSVATVSALGGGVSIERTDGMFDDHRRVAGGWQVATRGKETRAVVLEARSVEPSRGTPVTRAPATPRTPHRVRSAPLIFELGESHYRRSEQSWVEAGAPRALVAVSRDDRFLIVGVRVFTGEPVFAPPGAVNDMDNEHADVNGDGIQLHLRVDDVAPRQQRDGFVLPPGDYSGQPAFTAGWVAVPEPDDRIRVREIAGSGAGWLPDGGWQRMTDGYRLLLHLPLDRLGPGPTREIFLDVIVNETAPGRERRRGQLVLSGGRGEWVYLRGDRQPADRLLPFLIDDA